ncbi:hypothetical protein PAXINDRAFT_19748 [Paxillus involutus ATCC 200175]|uniref:Uncharacterized protein n=1 Tax=Paxillus involutus ATCC 200175 TaxID=664439 RepID=A0A0C9TIB7_PAXIN|nr:hypothetical protein PAXINDRAFT_19748 [Paxillus involutus ATCC 200175]
MHLYQQNHLRNRKVRSTSSHRINDVSRTKLLDIFKSLRHRKLPKDASRRVSLTRTRSFSPPTFACHTISPTRPLLPATSPPLCVSRCRSDAVSILSVTEEDHSSGMSFSSSSLDCAPEVEGGQHHFPHSILPASPSTFQLRSESTKDYLVERLEQHLQRLSISDASPATFPTSSSAIRPVPSKMTSSDDTPMDVYFESQRLDASLRQKCHPETSPPPPPVHVLREGQLSHDKPNSSFSSNKEVTVPVIVITSVGAEQAKPFQPSAPRSFRTPFGSSNLTNGVTYNQTSKAKQPPPEDPFMSQSPHVTYPPDYNLTFRIPPFASTESSPAWYAPETPTPMGCDHFGDCSGDLWDILHPPLVTHAFMLPPFALPPLNSRLFGDMSAPLVS